MTCLLVSHCGFNNDGEALSNLIAISIKFENVFNILTGKVNHVCTLVVKNLTRDLQFIESVGSIPNGGDNFFSHSKGASVPKSHFDENQVIAFGISFITP